MTRHTTTTITLYQPRPMTCLRHRTVPLATNRHWQCGDTLAAYRRRKAQLIRAADQIVEVEPIEQTLAELDEFDRLAGAINDYFASR